MRTNHMKNRMRQRGVSEGEVNMINDLGDWNERTDRLVLTQQLIARRQTALRNEIMALKHQARHLIQVT